MDFQKKLLCIILGYGNLKQANWGRVFKSFCLVLQENMCRNTSLYGRALVANSLAVSKIVFVAQHIIIPNDLCNRFVTKLFDFIWGRRDGQPRYESIKRLTLYNPARDGGINAVSIKLKCDALLIKHILRIISFSYSDYQPKWTSFAIYWIGLGLREYNENFSSNLIPHCMDFRPVFYENAYKLFKSYVENFPLTSPNHFSRPVKQIYMELLSTSAVPPRVTDIRIFPDLRNIDFRMLWNSCKLQFLDPELKNMRFKIAHHVLSLYTILQQRNIRVDNINCILCWPNRNIPETFEHFFLECPSITEVWSWISPKLFGLCNHRLKIIRDEVLYCQFPRNMPLISREILIFVVTLVAYSAWIHRHAIRFCGRSAREEHAVLELFKSKLKFRIRTDFHRFNETKFSEYWAKNEILCKTSQDGSCLEFLF